MNISIKTEDAPDGMVQWSASMQREGKATILCQGRAWTTDQAVRDAHWRLWHEDTLGDAIAKEPRPGCLSAMLETFVPGPPGLASANRARRHAVVAGRAASYQSRESKSWRKLAAAAIADADVHGNIDPRRPVEVTVCSYWPRWSRQHQQPLGDVDNPAKQVLDALVRAGVIVDDVLVERLVMSKWHDSTKPGIAVQVRQYKGAT